MIKPFLRAICTRLILVCGFCLVLSVQAAEPDWDLYDNVLAKHVKQGAKDGVTLNLVDYQALANDKAFAQVIASIAEFDTAQLTNREEKVAFYINAYNILALKIVADNWPLDSIKDIGNFFKPVWKHDAGKINDRKASLDEVEHEILRKMGEPRIHFAIVCASVSCPDLRTEAFRANKLEAQLEQQSKSFLSNPMKGLQVDGRQVEVSKIFKWFEDDFEDHGGIVAFIKRYVDLPEDADVRPTIDYNWSVNALKAGN